MPNDEKGLASADQAAGMVATGLDASQLAAFQGVKETGFEDTSREDFTMPFVLLLQDLSPQIKPSNSKYMPNAKPGLFFMPGGELAENFNFIPCLYQRKMVEWKPRKTGGGFVAVHEVGAEVKLPRDDHGSYITKDGNEIKDTRYYFGLRVKDNGALEPLIIAMQSTQIKKSKEWITKMEHLKIPDGRGGEMTAPMFATIWKISSESETRATNQFFGYKIEKVGPVTVDVFKKMQEWRESFKQTSQNIKPIDVEPDEPTDPANKPM